MCRGLLAVTHWGKKAADGNWPLDIDDKAVLDPSATVL
jgi:subtilisin-like proprotein convertase family protein